MAATERLHEEQLFHDRQARQRAATFAQQPQRFAVADAAYLDHETWIRPAFTRLGEVDGLQVLDFGCGHGMAAVVLARRGACVTAFDLSPGYLAEARQRAQHNDVVIHFAQADGERLPFADASFDRIWGHAVLHHLDMARAGPELARVLRPGGLAVFCEPWGENPLLQWARRHCSYSGQEHTAGEQPLRRFQVEVLGRYFAAVDIEGFQLLSMVRRLLGQGRWLAGLDCCDRWLLSRLPRLQPWCRYVVLTLRR